MTNYSFDENSAATLKIPAIGGKASAEVDCTYIEMRETRLTVESAITVPCSAPVSIQYEDALYLGEVVSTSVLNSGVFQIEIHVEQILSGLTSLLALRNQLMSERPVSPLAATPAGARA